MFTIRPACGLNFRLTFVLDGVPVPELSGPWPSPAGPSGFLAAGFLGAGRCFFSFFSLTSIFSFPASSTGGRRRSWRAERREGRMP